MIQKGSRQFETLAQAIDAFTTMDLTGVGLVNGLFEARQKHQSGPMRVQAAEHIQKIF